MTTTNPAGGLRLSLNVDRIRALAADPNSDLPDITDEQAEAVCRLLTSDALPRLAVS